MLYPVLTHPSPNGGMFSLIRFPAAIAKIPKSTDGLARMLRSSETLKHQAFFASRRRVRYAIVEQAFVEGSLVWRFRSPHHSSREFAMRTSEPKPHEINKLLVPFDSEVRKMRMPQNNANFGIGTLAS
jgi:hypothetical protein